MLFKLIKFLVVEGTVKITTCVFIPFFKPSPII